MPSSDCSMLDTVNLGLHDCVEFLQIQSQFLTCQCRRDGLVSTALISVIYLGVHTWSTVSQSWSLALARIALL